MFYVVCSSATDKAASLSDKSLLFKERKLHAISTYDLRTANQNIGVPLEIKTKKNTAGCGVSTKMLLHFHLTLQRTDSYLTVSLISQEVLSFSS
jgi:hypothetical protein